MLTSLRRVIVGAVLALGCYVVYKVLFDDTSDEGRTSREEGEKPPPEEPPQASVFFGLSHDEQLGKLIEMVKQGSSGYGLAREARKLGRLDELQALWVELLECKDQRMDEETFDTLTTFGPDGPGETERVNVRVDDALFKEQLLYVIRDSLEPDSPLLDRVIEAFGKEQHPWTRMRIIRAIGKVGGTRATRFLEQVAEEEGSANTYAAQEARRWLD